MTLMLVVAVVVVLVAGTVVYLQRRSAALKKRFGPEYARVVDKQGDRRSAEAILRERARRREALVLHDLSSEARDRYAGHWTLVQGGFVDDPGKAVAEADALVEHVMRERGYPVDEWDERFEMVSVDHPELAENYRVAHAIHVRSGSGDGDGQGAAIDDLREAFQRYRSLFDELLEDGAATPATASEEPNAPQGGRR
jgi:hypothetical protein